MRFLPPPRAWMYIALEHSCYLRLSLFARFEQNLFGKFFVKKSRSATYEFKTLFLRHLCVVALNNMNVCIEIFTLRLKNPNLTIPERMCWYTTAPQVLRWDPIYSRLNYLINDITSTCRWNLRILCADTFWHNLLYSFTSLVGNIATFFNLKVVTGQWLYLFH